MIRSQIMVHALPGLPARGVLKIAEWTVPCALGRSGIGVVKREGDGRTPRARLPVRRLFYRADRMARPETGLPVQAIHRRDGWCDAPDHPAYNTLVRLPFTPSHETLWREDPLYDLIVELGWNDDPPIAGMGSAIFMHIARDGFLATEGCIALNRLDLLRLIRQIGLNTCVTVR